MRTFNTTTNTNYKTVQVTYFIDSYSDIDDGSNCDMEGSDFVVDSE